MKICQAHKIQNQFKYGIVSCWNSSIYELLIANGGVSNLYWPLNLQCCCVNINWFLIDAKSCLVCTWLYLILIKRNCWFKVIENFFSIRHWIEMLWSTRFGKSALILPIYFSILILHLKKRYFNFTIISNERQIGSLVIYFSRQPCTSHILFTHCELIIS